MLAIRLAKNYNTSVRMPCPVGVLPCNRHALGVLPTADRPTDFRCGHGTGLKEAEAVARTCGGSEETRRRLGRSGLANKKRVRNDCPRFTSCD